MSDSPTARNSLLGPSLLSAEEISEFQRLVHETTGTCLTDDTAARRASELVFLIRAIVGRLPEETAFERSNVVPLD